MNHVPASGPVVKGFDVSSYQPTVNFSAAKVAAFLFCFLKSSEGVSIHDRTYASHRAGAKAAGIINGAYHFFHPKSDPTAQADLMFSITGKPQHGDLPPVVDLETMDGEPAAAVVRALLVMLNRLEVLTGMVPIIYCGPYFAQALSLNAAFAKYKLWVAEYGPSSPLVPPPWKTWTFWQNGDALHLPGSTGGADSNLFNGQLDQLMLLTAK